MTHAAATPPMLGIEWAAASETHARAVAQFANEARAVSPSRWQAPLGEGKWTPAEVTAHLIDAYGVLRRELAGGAGMQRLGSAPRQWLLRHFVMPRLIRGMSFPPGIPAPVETRPVTVLADAGTAVALLENVASRFVAELTDRRAAGPVWLTHAYFGRIPALQAIQLAAAHTRHHARQVARTSA